VQKVPRGAKLNSRPVDGTPCQFRTAYDLELAPIELENATLESPAPKDGRGRFAQSFIRLSMRCYGDANLHEIKMGDSGGPLESLRFYIDGDPQLVFPLYEIIFNHSVDIELRAKEPPLGSGLQKTLTNIQLKLPDPVIIPADESIKPVGFAPHESLLPYTKRSFSGYRILTEYFTFPYKFMFFDVCGLSRAAAQNSAAISIF
jgi:type VI secretion system protein ImpG